MKRLEKGSLIWGTVLGVLCVVSVLLYLFVGNGQVKRVLFFPDDTVTRTVGETRMLPKVKGDEENIEVLLKELILGPVDLSLRPLLPKHTKVRTCMLRKKTLYVDFSPELIVGKEKISLSVDEALAGVERSLRFNFPRIEEILFFIDGEMYSPGGSVRAAGNE
ncbi:MAG: GerMN domain-containing protein [Spirochaetales bacterium]|nr:GerMN domain-containing protein [Spirochaetales bacterium]